MSVTLIILWVLLIANVTALVVRGYIQHRNAVANYSCEAAQLDMKNAQKSSHKKTRAAANKLLFDVLKRIKSEANKEHYELCVDMSVLEKKHKFDAASAKKRRNAVKDSLRGRGFCIIPDTHNNEELIHISWQVSRANSRGNND